MNAITHKVLFGALFLFTLKELTEACSCFPAHPQQQFCNADVVIRAKVMAVKRISSMNKYERTIMYSVKVIKMFKGFEKIKDIHSVYTESESSMCGVQLNVDNSEYVLAGNIYDNKVHITLCGFNEPWSRLTDFQINSLSYTYKLGCECTIKNCAILQCERKGPMECFWNDGVRERKRYGGNQAENSACIKMHGSCGWFYGSVRHP